MTHTTEDHEPINAGSQEGTVHTINITSLTADGFESYDPPSEAGVPLGPKLSVVPVGQDNMTVDYGWDHTTNTLNVTLAADGTDVGNNTAPGEVRLKVTGGGV